MILIGKGFSYLVDFDGRLVSSGDQNHRAPRY